jgi:hypothetical protein
MSPGLENQSIGFDKLSLHPGDIVPSSKKRNCSGFKPIEEKGKNKKTRLVSPFIGLTLGEI